MDFSPPNVKIGRKMDSGQLLFLAMNYYTINCRIKRTRDHTIHTIHRYQKRSDTITYTIYCMELAYSNCFWHDCTYYSNAQIDN